MQSNNQLCQIDNDDFDGYDNGDSVDEDVSDSEDLMMTVVGICTGYIFTHKSSLCAITCTLFAPWCFDPLLLCRLIKFPRVLSHFFKVRCTGPGTNILLFGHIPPFPHLRPPSFFVDDLSFPQRIVSNAQSPFIHFFILSIHPYEPNDISSYKPFAM